MSLMSFIIDPLTLADICGNFRDLAPIALILIAFILPVTSKHLHPLEKAFNKLAQRKNLVIFLVALLTFIGSAIASWLFYFPIPTIHDEFGYLLTADTFAHGRLTNPTHPMWMHFETFHILHQPTYASKYFPAQGFILAIGQVIGGHPVVGVWLAISLTAAAMCWMLQAWLPPRWALLGSILFILKLGLFSYWSHSYWGGGVTATGAALVYGGLRRIVKKPTASSAIWFSLGLAILANSRPYEGLVISLPAIGYLIFWMLSKKSPSFTITFKQVVLPISLILTLTAIFIGYYNFVVTGSPWILPYRAYESIYGKLPHFFWEQPPAEIKYNHPVMRSFYRGWFLSMYTIQTASIPSYLNGCLEKLFSIWEFYLMPIFTWPLIALPFLLKNRWVRLALVSCLTLIIGMLLVVFSYGHFAAPGLCLLYFIVLQCLRRIYLWRWQNRPVGKLLVWSVPIYCILLIILPIALRENPILFVTKNPWEPMRTLDSHWSFKREAFIAQLKKEPGQHLIIMNYLPRHNVHNEWVFNEADIDNAKIVWARNMTPEKNCELINYFHNRKVWLIEVGNDPNIALVPYPLKCP